jgi:hypothetical protein
MSDIESGNEETGVFTADQIEGLRKMNERIDPAYARQRAAKRGGTNTLKGAGTPRQSSGAGEEFNISALSDTLGATDQTRSEGAQYGIDTSVDMGSSGDDPASSLPRRGAVGMGDIGGAASGYFGKHKDTPQYQMGLSLLETAGRCNHPRCQMIRAKGMEMIGADKRYQTGGQFWESKQDPIPSIATKQRYYPIVNGKEDRKNPQMETILSPADPNHPEWQALIKVAKGSKKGENKELFHPSSLLAHHHEPGDEDFEKNPLPWM